MVGRISLAAGLFAVLLAGAAEAQFTSAPPPKTRATRDSLPPTGRTIGGPSGMVNVAPFDVDHELLGFSGGSSAFVDACATVLNLGNGLINLIVRGSGTSSTFVSAGRTRTLCLPNIYNVSIESRDAPCTFEWRVGHAPVTQPAD